MRSGDLIFPFSLLVFGREESSLLPSVFLLQQQQLKHPLAPIPDLLQLSRHQHLHL
ncbi:hypothetical protein HHK36_015502 [Tetracentron sinense]|uniref:Uncharacterized protein n=1 Tax=Tetracentron sinense TaxID=13715 RepID=A0A835DCW0_TETSI|nr:hypothetical protein HHK36_015502 [Tetracentron sinense]